MAGLRIGYAIGNEDFVEEIEKNSITFRINYLAARAALAALDDQEFIDKCASFNDKERNFLYDELKNIGFNVVSPQGNFIYMYFDNHEDKEKTYAQLAKEGIIVCNLDVFEQKNSLRISIGNSETNERIIELLNNACLKV